MHLWGEPELLTDVIMHCDAFITGTLDVTHPLKAQVVIFA